jgi:hypothetical protein
MFLPQTDVYDTWYLNPTYFPKTTIHVYSNPIPMEIFIINIALFKDISKTIYMYNVKL